MAIQERRSSQHPDAIRARARRAVDPAADNIWHAEYNAKRKATNPGYLEKRRASARRSARNRRIRIKRFLVAARECPCSVCGVSLPPEVMDFDHLFGPKSFHIAHWGRSTYRTMQEIVGEVLKCRVVCPNCHRLRHYDERVAEAEGRFHWTDGEVSELLPRPPDLAAAVSVLQPAITAMPDDGQMDFWKN